MALAILWAAAALWIDGPGSGALAGTLAGGLILFAVTAADWSVPGSGSRLGFSWPLPSFPADGWGCRRATTVIGKWTSPGCRRRPWRDPCSPCGTLCNFAYDSETAFTENWESRTYDLDTLVGFDLFVSF